MFPYAKTTFFLIFYVATMMCVLQLHVMRKCYDKYCRNVDMTHMTYNNLTYQWFSEKLKCQYFVLATGLT